MFSKDSANSTSSPAGERPRWPRDLSFVLVEEVVDGVEGEDQVVDAHRTSWSGRQPWNIGDGEPVMLLVKPSTNGSEASSRQFQAPPVPQFWSSWSPCREFGPQVSEQCVDFGERSTRPVRPLGGTLAALPWIDRSAGLFAVV